MGAVVGYVQQNSSSGRYTIVQPGNRWPVGQFPTVPAAQRVLEGMAGRRYVWTRDDLGSVERWRANDPGWWPGNYDSFLKLFFTPGVGIVNPQDGGGVASWQTQDPSDPGAAYRLMTQATAAKQPAYTARGAGRQPALTFAETVAGKFLTGTFATLEAPFTIGLSAKYVPPVGPAATRYVAFGSTAFNLYVAGSGPSAGNWMAQAVPTTITGTIPASGGVDAIVANVSVAGTTLYVNGVESVASALAPGGAIGAITIGLDAESPNPWLGEYYGLVAVSRYSSLQEIANLTGYLQRLGA